jgi:hypothetical protein
MCSSESLVGKGGCNQLSIRKPLSANEDLKIMLGKMTTSELGIESG